jgi:hypothetical protein
MVVIIVVVMGVVVNVVVIGCAPRLPRHQFYCHVITSQAQTMTQSWTLQWTTTSGSYCYVLLLVVLLYLPSFLRSFPFLTGILDCLYFD